LTFQFSIFIKHLFCGIETGWIIGIYHHFVLAVSWLPDSMVKESLEKC